jgi:hypothetical protein
VAARFAPFHARPPDSTLTRIVTYGCPNPSGALFFARVNLARDLLAVGKIEQRQATDQGSVRARIGMHALGGI